MADAQDCGTVQTPLQWSSSGYFGEFSGYTFPTKQSDRVSGIGHRDIIHQGPGTSEGGWVIHTYGILQCRGRVVVPQLADLREKILREFDCSCFAMHLRGTKMYHDLRRQYYWSGMKTHVGDYVR